jgi:hypothetical protein
MGYPGFWDLEEGFLADRKFRRVWAIFDRGSNSLIADVRNLVSPKAETYLYQPHLHHTIYPIRGGAIIGV